MAKSTKETGPLQNLFIDIKKILDFIELKDNKAAAKAETEYSKAQSALWMCAIIKEDNYVTYQMLWTKAMFQEIRSNITENDYNYYCRNPYKVPYYFQDQLLEMGRAVFLAEYEETNEYYRKLLGLPPLDTNPEDYIYLSEELQEEYNVADDIPVHELSNHIQNLYMATDEYAQVVEENPDKTYLLYLGDKKVDLYTARKARDFEIIRYPIGRTDINPVLLKDFARLYKECREYVMMVLYNTKMSETYVNYREFMGTLIMQYTLMRVCATSLEGVNNGRYMDDTILHIILSMYGIPDDLLMNNSVRRDLVSQIKKLIQKKGTREVYYDIIDILGYQDIQISKLMLMKNQQFSGNDQMAQDDYEPYFVQIDLNDDNPYNTIITKKANTYSYHDIVDADPMWWDLPEVREILKSKHYTMADTKYITIEALIHQTKYVFESIYFTRMLLDNKSATDKFLINIPELFGTQPVSVYDIILFIICATCLANGLSGKIVTESDELLAISGFNFEAYDDTFMEYLDTTEYVDVSRLKTFLENITITSEDDINRVFNDTIYPLREWLEKKIVSATNKQEYVEYENIYRALFTYDIARNKFLDDFEMPMATIMEEYDITEEEMEAFRCFYPNADGKAIQVQDFNGMINKTKYHYPFLSLNDRIDWYVQIIIEDSGVTDDRGCLYFWNVLNCDDVRTLTNQAGLRIFMDYEDEEVGWEINQKAVDKALELIDDLDDDMLANAYFQIYTPGISVDHYNAKESLPPIIKASGIFKSILKEKIIMDCNGLCELPETYFDSLYRKNPAMYDLLMKDNRYETDRQSWYNDISTMISTMESALSIHMKYFEQSIIGESMFFKPLITLINHFKSTFVNIAKTSVKYIFDSKMDPGGSSNMLKLFDDMPNTKFHVILKESIEDSNFGLYDAFVSTYRKIIMEDKYKVNKIKVGTGFAAELKESRDGSLYMHDEVLIWKNGERLPDSKMQDKELQTIINLRK